MVLRPVRRIPARWRVRRPRPTRLLRYRARPTPPCRRTRPGRGSSPQRVHPGSRRNQDTTTFPQRMWIRHPNEASAAATSDAEEASRAVHAPSDSAAMPTATCRPPTASRRPGQPTFRNSRRHCCAASRCPGTATSAPEAGAGQPAWPTPCAGVEATRRELDLMEPPESTCVRPILDLWPAAAGPWIPSLQSAHATSGNSLKAPGGSRCVPSTVLPGDAERTALEGGSVQGPTCGKRSTLRRPDTVADRVRSYLSPADYFACPRPAQTAVPRKRRHWGPQVAVQSSPCHSISKLRDASTARTRSSPSVWTWCPVSAVSSTTTKTRTKRPS